VDGPYYSQRKHRITASGVYQFPGAGRRDLKGMLLGGWSIAPMFLYQSGQPWELPFTGNGSNLELIVDPKVAALSGKKEGQFIYGVKPCVGQRNATTGNYDLLSFSTAYGCTEPYFVIREPFQRRTTQFRYDEFRRPSTWDLTLSFAKTTPITDKVRMQVRLEAFNIFNSPMYDELQYEQSTGSADFGRINRNTRGQSNFQRFIQLGFKLIF
jgi:hypothetical protein